MSPVLGVRNVGNDFLVDLNSLEIGIGLKELIVIVQQHRGVIHRRKADRRNSDATDIPAIGTPGEDLRFYLQAQLIQSILKSHPVPVRSIQGGGLDEGTLLVVLELNAAASFAAPVQQLVLELQMLHVDGQTDVEAHHQFRWNHVALDASLLENVI